jgi:dipeptide transport system permease protein
MLRFILTRVSLVIPTFVGITLLTFFLVRLIPGDPIETMAGERGIDPVRHAELRKEYGFDQPILVQYAIYIGHVLRGDLGRSIITREPVTSEFLTLFPATIELSVCAILFALAIGLPAGIIAAVRRNSVFEHGVMGVTLLSDENGAFGSAVWHLILPTIVLGTVPLAVIARMTRSAMLEVLGEDYIRTARAKGLAPLRVIGLHALRNALIPVVTVIGLQVGVLATGAILTETIFSWPGIGKWLIEAINRRDYPVLQGGTLLIGLVVMGVNLLVDLTYGFINPRIRHTR